MKKKTILILLFSLFYISICSCDNPKNINTADIQNVPEGLVMSEALDNTFIIESIPQQLPYNNTFIVVDSFTCFEEFINYSYEVYCELIIDVSQLSDTELHYLGDGSEFSFDTDMNIGILLEDVNSDDYIHLHRTSCELIDGKYIIQYSTVSTIEHRDSFKGKELSLHLGLINEGSEEHTYMYDILVK